MTAQDSGSDVWAPVFGHRCKARLRRATAKAWGQERWGRCELRPHRVEVDHALEYGLLVLMWNERPVMRVHLEPTDVLVALIADRMHGEGQW